MKNILLIIALVLLLNLSLVSAISEGGTSGSGGMIGSGSMMMGFSGSSPDNATIQSQQQEEQEGKMFLDNLNNKTVFCSQLNDADFDKIGEYFMGQSIGDTSRHIAMNEMMKSMMGERGEEQMHIAMGKRMSNCEPDAPMPQNMMNMMGSGMMGNWGYFGYWNFLNILYVILLIGLIVLVYLWIVKLWENMRKKGGRK
ncbi:MAG: hypothetical protein HY831_00075 [Candidatus Aenigmarchaeota archaeon]|nr:hypothetical protein [Candidatus Aenigmarchaeota archaeon]